MTLLILVALLLAGCNGAQPTRPADLPATSPPIPASTLAPAPTPTPPPAPEATAAAFLTAWEQRDYAAMYTLLSPNSQAMLDLAGFTKRYQGALDAATVLTVTTRLQAALQDGDVASVSFHVTFQTALVGELSTDNVMTLNRRGAQWLVEWGDGLIWPQLAGGRYFWMDYIIPARANIYDRNGLALATTGKIVTLGLVPGQIEDEDALLAALATVTGLSPDEIRGRYITAPANWKVPIADISAEASVEYNDLLAAIPGVYREEKDGRTYPQFQGMSIAPHVVGWVSPIPAERLAEYHARGYRGDEWVGIAGLEAWGETYLAGQHGGVLSIITREGERVATVAERPAAPSRAIYTTLDRDFQGQVQHILGGRRGAIVVLDVHTGAVLALASGPGFDTNVFISPADVVGRSQILADPRRPLFNRATQGAYPAASVFKIVTMAAALEEGGMRDQTPFYCPGYWEGLGASYRKGCWKETGHGDITLKDGLTASCDVVFYTVGQTLDAVGRDVLPRFGRGFGFGAPTGLVGLYEEGGVVPDPAWKMNAIGENWWVGDTINIAIGQGYLLVTPLQVARMIAAVANGGTLYRPYLVARVAAGGGAAEQTTQPEVVGALPVSAEHLAAIQEALLGVTTRSIGTALYRFQGLAIPVAGKTGTAEVGGPETTPHSWFAAYAPANAPEIAIAVIVENAGEGSAVAAPLARQVIEAYYGLPLSPLPPQAEEGYVPPTPTPQP